MSKTRNSMLDRDIAEEWDSGTDIRSFLKRKANRAERRAAVLEIVQQVREMDEERLGDIGPAIVFEPWNGDDDFGSHFDDPFDEDYDFWLDRDDEDRESDRSDLALQGWLDQHIAPVRDDEWAGWFSDLDRSKL